MFRGPVCAARASPASTQCLRSTPTFNVAVSAAWPFVSERFADHAVERHRLRRADEAPQSPRLELGQGVTLRCGRPLERALLEVVDFEAMRRGRTLIS